MNLSRIYRNYLFAPRYWLKGLKNPMEAGAVLFAILRHPKLYANVSTKVEGLIGHHVGTLLYDSVLRCKSGSLNVIEVGAFKGLSTCYLSLAAAKVGKRVKSFELFSGLPTSDPVLDPEFHVGQFSSEVIEYETNLRNHGNRDVVDLVIGDARQTFLPALDGQGFCVAFLDADVYEVMREMLFQLWTIAKGDEIIIVHDIYSPGVRKALDAFHTLSQNRVKETRLGRQAAKLELPRVR